MSAEIGVENLEGWIGREVQDAGGGKVGKLEEVHFRGTAPAVLEVRSGFAGRKRRLASAEGLRVTRDAVVLPIREDELMAASDEQLRALGGDDLEGSKARDERLAAEREALARADRLDEEARQRAAEADAALDDADRSRRAAQEAEELRAEAERAAAEARRSAG